jgi:hypothetical protein
VVVRSLRGAHLGLWRDRQSACLRIRAKDAMHSAGTIYSSGGFIASTGPVWLVGMGDGGAVAGIPTGTGAGVVVRPWREATPEEVMRVPGRPGQLTEEQFPRDRQVLLRILARRPVELRQAVRVRLLVEFVPARHVRHRSPSIAAAADKYCDRKSHSRQKPWVH